MECSPTSWEAIPFRESVRESLAGIRNLLYRHCITECRFQNCFDAVQFSEKMDLDENARTSGFEQMIMFFPQEKIGEALGLGILLLFVHYDEENGYVLKLEGVQNTEGYPSVHPFQKDMFTPFEMPIGCDADSREPSRKAYELFCDRISDYYRMYVVKAFSSTLSEGDDAEA